MAAKKTDGDAVPAETGATDAKTRTNDSYFVSPHQNGGWQVKRTGAQKALKLFKTKAEAEAYAKQVAGNQGIGVVRQKKDGKIQKKKRCCMQAGSGPEGPVPVQQNDS